MFGDVSEITAWYWLLTFVVVGVSIVAVALRKTISPLLFGGLFGFVLVIGAKYLEPALFGWMSQTDVIIIGLSFAFMISWGILIILYLYNSLRYGEVIK